MTNITPNRLITAFNRKSVCFGYRVMLFVLLMTLVFPGCKPNDSADESAGEPEETEKVAALRKEVLTIHDEVMPLMTDIYQLKNKLREKIKSGTALSGEEKKRFESAILDLDSADRGMRIWMREFSEVQTTGIPEADAISNLNLELKKITKVKEDMVTSVEAAKALEK
jgi:hypothetical protein